MSFSSADTQPIRAVQSGPGCLKRIVRLQFMAILAVGIFALGYATASGAQILAPVNNIIKSAIASLPDLADANAIPSPSTSFAPPPAEAQESVPPDAATFAPSPTNTLTLAPVPTDAATDTPLPTSTLTQTPIPTATEPPPTQTPVPTATSPPPTQNLHAPSCFPHEKAWVAGPMNVRQYPTTAARRVAEASAGESYAVLESRQGETYCWLRIDKGWMAGTALVSATKPQQPVSSSADGGVRQALASLNALVVAPEHRCSPYDSDSYPYSQSVEAQIVARMGGRIYGPYTGRTFSSTGETDIEHIVAKSEAHDSGLCSAGAQTRRTFSNDLLNLTLASPSVNRHQKSGKDFAEWRPALNQCWFADTIIKVKAKYGLTVDGREKAALERTLQSCGSVSMIFSGTARPLSNTSGSSRQTASSSQQQQPASSSQQQQQPAANQNQQHSSDDWRQWDSNGNGRITCAEARAAGIAPVHRGHPAYPRMDDRDNDGVVCE